MTQRTKCWYVSNYEWWMLVHETTRSRAIDAFLRSYTDNYYWEYASGLIRIKTMRIPELDGHVDVDSNYEVLLKRGLITWCPRCDYESLVAAPMERWELYNCGYWDYCYRLAYKIGERVMCSECARENGGEAIPIEVDESLVRQRSGV